MILSLFVSVSVWAASPALASQILALPAIQEGQLIVRSKNAQAAMSLLQLPGIHRIEALVPDLNIYLVSLEGTVMSARSSLQNFQQQQDLLWVQLDHLTTYRLVPNDPDLSKQWNILNGRKKGADINATEAWNITTGGRDQNGNEIVVAVVDGGAEVTHSDLRDNMWINKYEIPGNGVDDDGNGYVDDIYGWDAFADNYDVTADDHATHVAGIIGAKGDNRNMMAGINWSVKIMTVEGAGATSVVLRAYGYVLKNKKLWLETHGEKGANIVSTNSSFGVDYANCASGQYPAWNDMYNEMGKSGILSAAATANRDLDVDMVGDVPTGCDSPYLISVTNTTNNDNLHKFAAYGKTMVDIGAPGTDIYSTVTKDKLQLMTGTSMATPHVAGGIALLHSAASKVFADFYMRDPSAAALKLKELVLRTVDPLSDLKDKSVSGGRLNLGRAAQVISVHE